KGQVVIEGQGYELQGEDAPNNPDKSNIEFVSTHFPESKDGYVKFYDALNDMLDVAGDLLAKSDPGPTVRTRDLHGSVKEKKAVISNLMPGAAVNTLKVKPQMTVGVALENLSTLMSDIFKSDDNEPVNTSNRLQEGRQALGSDQTGPISTIIGGAPAKAQA